MTPAERALRARIAANTKWATTADRSAATAKARRAFADRWERHVDPDGVMSPEDRARAAQNAKRAHFQRMALKSAQSRRRKTA